MDMRATIMVEFRRDELSFIDAVERLQHMGYEPKDAEQIVEQWEWLPKLGQSE
jgi:hypothetical protein